MRPLRTSLLLALLVTSVALAACGDSDSESSTEASVESTATTSEPTGATFEQEGYPFTFEYPEDFETSTDVTFDSELGGAADDTIAVGIDDANGLVIQRFTLNVEVDDAILEDVKAEFDGLVGQVDPDASAEVGETAGFLSLSYDAIQVPQPPEGESRITVLFEGDQEYLINCQSTPEEREAIDAACDQALATLTAT